MCPATTGKRLSTWVSSQWKPAENALKAVVLTLNAQNTAAPEQTTLLMREFLDNKRRADTAGTWYLKRFLERFVVMVKEIPNWHDATDAEALALVYQLLGAINYYAISEPTLVGIFGAQKHKQLKIEFPRQLSALISSAVSNGPAPDV